MQIQVGALIKETEGYAFMIKIYTKGLFDDGSTFRVVE